MAHGFDVVQLGLTATPTVQLLVPKLKGVAGIIVTSSHNPVEWNGLKFVDEEGSSSLLSPPT